MEGNNLFTDIKLVKKLDYDGNVILVRNTRLEENFVLKTFPYNVHAKLSGSFKNEMRVVGISHPNIIVPIAYQLETKLNNQSSKKSGSSCIIMEYACNGDLSKLKKKGFSVFQDEKFVRTLFHQLLSGLEFLHQNNTSHLDLKLRNLAIGKDFLLKIIDFDISAESGAVKKTLGTDGYRAPEIGDGSCLDSNKADIYSAGMVLLAMRTKDFPLPREKKEENKAFTELLQIQPAEFWRALCQKEELDSDYFDPEYKNLFEWMTKQKPEDRPTIQEIRESRWYTREIYEQEEMERIIKDILKIGQNGN